MAPRHIINLRVSPSLYLSVSMAPFSFASNSHLSLIFTRLLDAAKDARDKYRQPRQLDNAEQINIKSTRLLPVTSLQSRCHGYENRHLGCFSQFFFSFFFLALILLVLFICVLILMNETKLNCRDWKHDREIVIVSPLSFLFGEKRYRALQFSVAL